MAARMRSGSRTSSLRSRYNVVEERIFKPLEMQHSVVQPADALLHRTSIGHFLNKDGINIRTSFAFGNPSLAPAGATAMFSAKDLATFAVAHVNDGVAANRYVLAGEWRADECGRKRNGGSHFDELRWHGRTRRNRQGPCSGRAAGNRVVASPMTCATGADLPEQRFSSERIAWPHRHTLGDFRVVSSAAGGAM